MPFPLPMDIMQSFRFRIFALVLSLVAIVISATVFAVATKAQAEVGRQASLELRAAADTAREVLKFRGNQLTSAAEVLTSDFGFKEAIASGDTATLLSAVKNDRARIGADVLIVLGSDGQPLASSLPMLTERTRNDLQELIASDADGQMLRLYRLIDGRPYQLVVAPVLAPDPIGWAAMGFALDDKVAADMARLLGVEVTFLAGGKDAPGFIASSLPLSSRGELAAVSPGASTLPFRIRADHDEFLTWTNPIRSANGALTLVLQRSLASALSPYLQLRASILRIGLGILVVAAVLAGLLARSATRPLAKLIVAAERLESGDYTTPAPQDKTIEFTRLSNAFNAMRGAVAERERINRHQALHDSLTGLPNQLRMIEVLSGMLERAASAGSPVAICVIQIVEFQQLVGSLGHAAADVVLNEIAKRLLALRQLRAVGRAGTDQFSVLIEELDAEQSLDAGNRITEALRAPFEYTGISLQIETRIGIAMFPEDATRAEDLFQLAELALYRTVSAGASVGAFVRGDDQLQKHRLTILGDLRRAILADELELHYQPKVSLPAGMVVGCEALVRWRHPQKGLIPPSEFVAHAERTGLIRVLTTWVLGAAFRQSTSWQRAGLTLDVSINVSPSDLADPSFAHSVFGLLEQSGVDATRIVLEVTESGAMRELAHTLKIMEELRLAGIRFSIDDFGTGYSSLAHLKQLPVDEIKIDRSFVQELEKPAADDVILRSTISLGHALNLKVVAEGVEISTSWDALCHYGCDMVQGYYVSKPLPAADFEAWVMKRLQDSSPAAREIAPVTAIAARRSSGG